jgi:cell wall-associated NlpC family hydrolase
MKRPNQNPVESDKDHTELWWSLDVAKLVVGDIICTNENTKASRLIRQYTGQGRFSHVALYLGDNYIIEAVVPKVIRRLATEYILTDDEC